MTQAVENTPAYDRFYVDDLYCTLHRANPGQRRGVCVIFSPPMGRDARWVYRSMVIFAAALAARGFDVVRFDPAGEGDSGELSLDADQWGAWTSGLVKATAAARTLTGAQNCVLLGLRMGATIARVAAEAAGADGLVLLDPMASGRAWIQELTFLQAMAIEPRPPQSAIEGLGLRISHATAKSLEAVDLTALTPLDIPCLYASPIKNNGVIGCLGPRTEIIPFKGYVSFFKEGHVNTYPEWTFAQVQDWLEASFEPSAKPGPQVEPTQRRLVGDGYIEEPVVFGAEHCGILTLPVGPGARSSVLIGNTGGDPRAGTGNFSAFMARTLARRNIATLRMDFHGLGESASRFGRSHVYEESRTEAFRTGADFMTARGLGDPDLIGVCTGGYHAVRALLDDPRFTRVMAINSWILYRPGVPLEREGFLRSLRSRFMDAQPELAAKVDPLLDTARALIASGAPRAAATAAAGKTDTEVEIDPIAVATNEQIDAALRDGRSICLVMGERDPSLGGLTHFGYEGLERMLKGGMVQHLEPIDHGLFSLDSQMITLDRIIEFLEQPTRLDNAAATA